ncbi:MAG: cytochrome c5 family protein [Gammaproteobacteria bacterium]|nr:cytochrome c5 family protein [Gammaproteobacteria bacterium]
MRQEEDASFGRTFVAVLGALVVASVVILVLARAIGEREASAAQGTVAERTAPVGKVKVAGAETIAPRAANPGDLAGTPQAEQAAAQAPLQIAQADKGKTVYDTACVVCHQTGVGGAPKIGDKAAWADRIAQGESTLADHAIKGFQGKTGMMPPKGGRAELSDEDVKAAVSYMVGASQ